MNRHSFVILATLSMYTVGMVVFYIINQKTQSLEMAASERFTGQLQETLGL